MHDVARRELARAARAAAVGHRQRGAGDRSARVGTRSQPPPAALGRLGRDRRQEHAVVELAGAAERAQQLAHVGLAAAELAGHEREERDADHRAIVLLVLRAAARVGVARARDRHRGPYALRVLGHAGGLGTSISAGFGWAAVGLATALIDEELADRHWLLAVLWGAGVGIATWSSLLAEMTALQTWPATRSIPVVFGIEMVLPAAVLPILTHTRPGHVVSFAAALAVACAGAAILGSSRAVARAAAPLTEP